MSAPTWTSQLRSGDWLSRTSYMKIIDHTQEGFKVTNESGLEWSIASNIVENECQPAFEYKGTQQVSRSELARLLLEETRGAVVSVCFTKQQTPERIVKMLEEADTTSMSTAEKKHFAASLLVGERRYLTGYVLDRDANGRIKMIDLNVEGKNKIRLVDARTLEEATFRGTKYEVK